ncbi:22097_t:CDS:2, partial [Gigaspora margarita]
MASNSNTPINNTPALIDNTSAPHNNTTNNNTHDNTPNINNNPLSDNTTSNTNLLPDNTSNNNLPPPYPVVFIDNNQYISNTPRQLFNIVDDYNSDSSVRSIASIQNIFANMSSKSNKGKSKQNQSKQNLPHQSTTNLSCQTTPPHQSTPSCQSTPPLIAIGPYHRCCVIQKVKDLDPVFDPGHVIGHDLVIDDCPISIKHTINDHLYPIKHAIVM